MIKVIVDDKEVKKEIQETVKNLLDPIDYISINKETFQKITGMDVQFLDEHILSDKRIKLFLRKRKGGRKPYWLTETKLGTDKYFLRDAVIEVMNEWS